MEIIRLSEEDINLMQRLASELIYFPKKNIIRGVLSFNLQFGKNGEKIIDKYQIEIDLNNVDQGLPIVRETGKRIRNIAIKKGLKLMDLHIDNNDEMCLIIPPKIKEKYPNGFDLETLIEHIQEHLYYISFFEKYNKEPWKAYGHGDEGYLDLYLEDRGKYYEDFKRHFDSASRPEFRRKLNELRKVYKK